MAEVTPRLRDEYGASADAVPPEILKAISQDELLDRLDQANDLFAKSLATSSPTLSAGYRSQARIVLKARPRDMVEAEANVWLAKAENAATAQYRETCLAEAGRIRTTDPAAPRRKRAPAAPPSPAELYKSLPALPLPDPEAPATRAWLAQQVKAEVARAGRAASGLLLK
jgi:hypothetical protein